MMRLANMVGYEEATASRSTSYFKPKSVLKQMRYKSYTWEYNPGRCSYSCDRSMVRHRYPELVASDIEDMDVDGAIITGTGEFFGPTAYDEWMKLVMVFKEHGPGEFFHPIFQDVAMAILKKLDATVEPRENYVAYSFEFWQHDPPRISITKIETANITQYAPGSTGSSQSINIYLGVGSKGDMVSTLQHILIQDGQELPNYGSDGVYGSETESAVRKYQSKHGLSVDGVAGPETLTSMGVSNFIGGIIDSQSTQRIYTVVSGDCLSTIASKYGITWQSIASANSIKNPNVINIGQQLVIP